MSHHARFWPMLLVLALLLGPLLGCGKRGDLELPRGAPPPPVPESELEIE